MTGQAVEALVNIFVERSEVVSIKIQIDDGIPRRLALAGESFKTRQVCVY